MVIVCFIPTYLDDNGVSGYLHSTGDIHRATHQLQRGGLMGRGGGRRREGEGRREEGFVKEGRGEGYFA